MKAATSDKNWNWQNEKPKMKKVSKSKAMKDMKGAKTIAKIVIKAKPIKKSKKK